MKTPGRSARGGVSSLWQGSGAGLLPRSSCCSGRMPPAKHVRGAWCEMSGLWARVSESHAPEPLRMKSRAGSAARAGATAKIMDQIKTNGAVQTNRLWGCTMPSPDRAAKRSDLGVHSEGHTRGNMSGGGADPNPSEECHLMARGLRWAAGSILICGPLSRQKRWTSVPRPRCEQPET